jgi:hypothetical protein
VVIDVGAQRVQRHAAFAVPLRTRDFSAIQAPRHVDFDPERTQAHGIAHGALHRAAEHDAALELLRDAFRYQLRVEFGLAHFGHVDVGRNPHHRGDFLAQALDVLALLADHHARAGGMDRDAGVLGRTLDLDAAHAGLRQLGPEQLAHLEIRQQVVGEILLAREPLRVPVLGDAKADTGGMNFVTHLGYLPLSDRRPRPR